MTLVSAERALPLLRAGTEGKNRRIQPADLWHHKDTQQHCGEKNWENGKEKEIGRGGGSVREAA